LSHEADRLTGSTIRTPNMEVRLDERGALLPSMRSTPSRSRRRPTVGSIVIGLFAVAITLTIAACSSYSTSNKSTSLQNRAIQESSPADRSLAHPRPENHAINRGLVIPQSGPNCELAGPEPDTVDAELWARLKLDYERLCYKQAEMLARKRLRQLLALGRCGGSESFRSSTLRHNYATVK
jgi:hypothetical protein